MLPFFFRPTIKVYGINFVMFGALSLTRFAWDRWTRLNYTTWSPCIIYIESWFHFVVSRFIKIFCCTRSTHRTIFYLSTLHATHSSTYWSWMNECTRKRSCCVVIRRIRKKIIYNLNICISVICLASPSVACLLTLSIVRRSSSSSSL